MNEEAIKKAFSKVKEDMEALNHRLDLIDLQIKEILAKFNPNPPNYAENSSFRPSKPQILPSSSGNEGVQSINHSTINQSLSNQSLQQNIPSLSIQALKRELESRFKALTNQEFLLFLTIYQLEEDLGRPVTYFDLSQKLSLTSGCIRGYISALLRKNLPIIKSKINNRTLTLSINPQFRDLKLKERLTNLFYNMDPDQTRLF